MANRTVQTKKKLNHPLRAATKPIHSKNIIKGAAAKNHQQSTNLHEESKMSSIHNINKLEAKRETSIEDIYQVPADDDFEQENIKIVYDQTPPEEEEESMLFKPKESIEQDLRQFENSINQIDDKFSILNKNLAKYQQLTESARKALISRENTANRSSKTKGEHSSGFPTDRIIDEIDSAVNDVSDVS